MLGMTVTEWDMLGHTDILETGTQLAAPELLFEKIEDSVIEAQIKNCKIPKSPTKKPTT